MQSAVPRASARARVNHWLHAAMPHLGLELDDAGVCGIGHECGLECTVEVPEPGEQVFLRIGLINLAGIDDAQLRRCMSEHLLGLHSGGAVYAIDPDEQQLVVWEAHPVALLDAASFAQVLVDCFANAQRCQARLHEDAATPRRRGGPAASIPAPHLHHAQAQRV